MDLGFGARSAVFYNWILTVCVCVFAGAIVFVSAWAEARQSDTLDASSGVAVVSENVAGQVAGQRVFSKKQKKQGAAKNSNNKNVSDNKSSKQPRRSGKVPSRDLAGDLQGNLGQSVVNTLEDALAQAYTAGLRMQAQEAATRAADEGLVRAQTGYRPSVEGTAGYSDSRTSVRTNFGGGTQRQATVGASLRQPLINFAYFPQVDRANAEIAASRANLIKAEQEVLQSAIRAYMEVLRDKNILDQQKANESFYQEILHFAQIRYEVGDSSITDLAESKAKLAEAKSARINAQSALAKSESLYRSVMNVEQVPGLAHVDLPELPGSLDDVIASAKTNLPDIQVALASIEGAEAEIRAREYSFLPTVNLTASAGRTNGFGANGIRSDNTTIGANLSIPLDVSGALQSELRRSHDLYVKSKLELEAVIRDLGVSATTAWEDYNAAVAATVEREAQVASGKTTVDSMKLEYELGSRSLTDLFVAQSNLVNAEVALERSKAQIVVSAYNVLAVMGKLTAANLKLNVTVYNPEEHYNQVDGKWWGLGSALD